MTGPTAEQDEFARQLSEWARRMSAAGGIPPDVGATPGQDHDAPDRAGSTQGTPGDALGEVALQCMQSGLRLWTRSAEVWVKLGLAVLQDVGRTPTGVNAEDTRSPLIAELRTALRELAAVSSQEARRLDAELEKLAPRGRREAPCDEPGPYWRRWEVKP
jgi:hypothetical protein